MNDDFTLGIIMQLHGGQDMTRAELVELLHLLHAQAALLLA